MALKTKEIRAMGPEDRAKALTETRAELMHQRGLAAMGGAVKNPGRIRDLRTSIARVLTIQRQDLLAAHAARGTRAPRQPRAGQRPAATVAKAIKDTQKPKGKAKPAAAKGAKGKAKGGPG